MSKSFHVRHLTSFRRDDGLTLVEILIAVLVLSIGLVGLASLHLTGLRNAHSSYYTTIASSVALDFEERLWIGMANITDGCLDGNDVNTIITGLVSDWQSNPAGSQGTVTLPGLAVTRTAFDDSTSDDWIETSIAISWDDGRLGQGTEQFRYTARLVCAPSQPSGS